MKESGLWYLPNSQTKVPGKLFVNDNKTSIILKLYATTYLSGNAFEFLNSKQEDDYVEIILGDTRNSPLGNLTLFGCSFAKLAPIAGELHELHYNVQFVFNYVHILHRDKLKFNYIEILYPNSDNFFNGWDKLNREDDNPKSEYVKVTSTIKIDDGLSIDIVDSKRHTISMSKNFEVLHDNHLTFNYSKTVDIDKIYKDCVTLQKMMEFSSRRKLAFIIKNAKIDIDNVSNHYEHHPFDKELAEKTANMAHTYIYSRLTLNQEPFENKSKLNQNWLLFSKWTESEDSLSELLRNWFKNEKLQPIYDFYIDTIDFGKDGAVSNVNFNNRYLNLMQGIEAFYDYLNPEYTYTNESFIATRQKVYNALESDDLKSWVGNHLRFPKEANFSHKLKFLCDKYFDILRILKADETLIIKYPYKAKEYRHKLSHGKINKTFQGKDLNSLYAFSQVLLCICILDSIGMDYTKIAERINSNPDINRQIPR